MTMTEIIEDIEQRKQAWTEVIFEAQRDQRQISAPSKRFGELNLEQAYDVQLRLADRWGAQGFKQLGWKVGATSFAILEQMKGRINEPMYGYLREGKVFGQNERVARGDFFGFGLEAEIGVVMGRNLKGPNATAEQAAEAVESVIALGEILDGRIAGQPADRTIMDGAADNGLHGGIIYGPKYVSAQGFDFEHEGVVVHIDGKLFASACGVEALGSPLNVVAWLANALARQGRELEAGQLISTGSLTKIIKAEPGQTVEMSWANLGVLTFTIVE